MGFHQTVRFFLFRLSTYLPIYPSIYLSTYLSTYLHQISMEIFLTSRAAASRPAFASPASPGAGPNPGGFEDSMGDRIGKCGDFEWFFSTILNSKLCQITRGINHNF
jgi:hypothetical protein